jgi:membrane protein YdbS with pleckstrin-like domain
MNNLDLSSTEIVIALASALVLVCFVVLMVVPATRCYGRVWEKLAAGILSLYVLATLLGIGAALGLAIVWTYDTYA